MISKGSWTAVRIMILILTIAAIAGGTAYAASAVSKNNLLETEAAEDFARLDAEVLFEGVEDFVAPEVLEGNGQIDERADVYSLAKFVDWLYHSAGLPFELKHVLAKATDVNPDERYTSVKAFQQAMQKATARKWRASGRVL